MEIKLGTKVETLIDKHIVERINENIFVPKGLFGYVCDIEYINDGFVLVQFSNEAIIKNGTGVYSYKLSEIRIIE